MAATHVQRVPTMPHDRVHFRMYMHAGVDADVVFAACEAQIAELTKGYLWHNEDLHVTQTRAQTINVVDEEKLLEECDNVEGQLAAQKTRKMDPSKAPLMHEIVLVGSSDFGDNIEDEWFILQCLLKITELFPLVLQIHDSDGEFVLIEAADVIPRWLTPECAVNRVFFMNGKCHIVPQPESPDQVGVLSFGPCRLECALQILFEGKIDTKANVKVQQIIERRLSDPVLTAARRIHTCRVILPRTAARILSDWPQLTSFCVNALAYRDPQDMTLIAKMEHFEMADQVTCSIPLTRFCYAQLQQQAFKPPTKIGRIPPSTHADYKPIVTGCRLLAGLELLLCKGEDLVNADVPSQIRKSQGFQKFLKSLRVKDYFEGVVEGSKRHHELLSKALYSYLTLVRASEGAESGLTTNESVAMQVYRMFKHLDEVPDRIDLSGRDDDDSWLDVSMEDIDAKLESYRTRLQQSFLDPTQSTIAADIQTFLSATSTVEGIKTADSDVEDESENEHGEDELMAEPPDVNIDGAEFVSFLSQLLGTPTTTQESAAENLPHLISQGTQENSKSNMHELWEMMDAELHETTIAQSFELSQDKSRPKDTQKESDTVDVDFNLVKNLLESFQAQQGSTGPTSNVLSSM